MSLSKQHCEKPSLQVPFFRPSISKAEIDEVVACLRSVWPTTGPRAQQFEISMAGQVGAKHAVALNSCTAALHLAVESLGLGPGQAVLVPTMTFAATAEVVRYQGAVPLLVDCDPVTLNMDLADAARKIEQLRAGQTPLDPALRLVGVIPVHVGGLMMDMDQIRAFAAEHGLWVVEDAAHSFPAAYRISGNWRRCGEDTAEVTCFSFYANKTMTTGEGGMAVTDDTRLADRMRQMSLHGLSHDAWKRYAGNHAWDYRIVAPGYKYNLTTMAPCQMRQGLRELSKIDENIAHRIKLTAYYQAELPRWGFAPLNVAGVEDLPMLRYPVRVANKNEVLRLAMKHGVEIGSWFEIPLHPAGTRMESFGYRPGMCPEGEAASRETINLPTHRKVDTSMAKRTIEFLKKYARPAS